MENDDGGRFLATCSDCGNVFAGTTVSSGEIQAIGSRNGCPSCGGADFSPVTAPSSAPEFGAPQAGD